MAIYPLSKLLFRAHELTSTQFRLCPACLKENNIENSNCSYCGEDIPNYDEEKFIFERIKRISDIEEIGIGAGNEKLNREKNKFNTQYNLWDQVVLVAKFVRSYTLSRIDPLDYARAFLSQFPLTEKAIETLQISPINLQLPKQNSSDIKKKLMEIEHRDNFGFYADFASWSWVFLDETESPFIFKNLNWINVRYGSYKDFNGQEIRIDENNPVHVDKAIENIPAFDPTKLNIEVLLFPLHWKFLAEEKLKVNAKPMLSKPRYQAALERWTPTTKSHQAWKELGLYYCQHARGEPCEVIREYRDQQIAQEFGDRDFNFLFSLAMISNQVSEAILEFPSKRDSYFAPLISLYRDESYINEYFLNSSNREAWLRALHFYDFSTFPFQSELAAKIVIELSDEEYANSIGLIHRSLLKFLLKPALENGSKKKISLTLDVSNDWDNELQSIDLIGLYKKDAETLLLLLEKTSANYSWASSTIILLLKEQPSSEPLVNKCIQILRKDSINKSNLLSELFNLWIANSKQISPNLSSKYFESLPAFMESKNIFSLDFKETDFRKTLLALWTSPDGHASNLAEEFIDSHVDVRGTRLGSVESNYTDQEIFKLFRVILVNSKLRCPRSIAYTFIFELMQQDRLSTEELNVLWADLPMMDNEHRVQLEYRIKEKLPSPVAVKEESKHKEAEAKAKVAQDELAELKIKMAQMEQQQKIADERNRIIQEVKDKSTRYQIKLTELQSQYQIEVTKIMASSLAPDEKSKKVTELSAQFQKDMVAVSEILK